MNTSFWSADGRPLPCPPSLSLSADSKYFQLRCHVYQGRGLMAAEDNGLSAPFAKVLFSTQCQVTKVGTSVIQPALKSTNQVIVTVNPKLNIVCLFRCCMTLSLQPGVRLCSLTEFCWREQLRSFNKTRPSSSSTSTAMTTWYHGHSSYYP